jgi:hypothetical protein
LSVLLLTTTTTAFLVVLDTHHSPGRVVTRPAHRRALHVGTKPCTSSAAYTLRSNNTQTPWLSSPFHCLQIRRKLVIVGDGQCSLSTRRTAGAFRLVGNSMGLLSRRCLTLLWGKNANMALCWAFRCLREDFAVEHIRHGRISQGICASSHHVHWSLYNPRLNFVLQEPST